MSVTMASLQCTFAQEKKQETPKAEPVKIELPSDNIIRHFRSRNSGTAVVDWYQLKDGKTTYVIGYYSTDGDQRKVVYRNGAYYCTENGKSKEKPCGEKAYNFRIKIPSAVYGEIHGLKEELFRELL